MTLLADWRDAATRGRRIYVAADGREIEASLSDACAATATRPASATGVTTTRA